MKKIKNSFFGLLLLSSALASAQAGNQKDFIEKMDSYGNSVVQKLGIPGFAAVVIQDGKTVLAKGYGFADVENRLAATGNTEYYIASTTKSFTALLATILDDSGILKLDDPVGKYFPDTKTDPGVDLNKVKIRDLLTHTSGIENNPIAWRVAFSGEHDLPTLINLMRYCKPNEAGYGNYEYTNTGYNIYAIILEKKTGKPWQEWMQEKLFKPAGMDHTTASISKAEKKHWPMAKPYMVTDSVKLVPLVKKDNTMQSAGGLITTPEDMAIWLKLQLAKGKLNGKQIIPEKIMAASQQKLVGMQGAKRAYQPNNYGMGWMFGQYENQEIVHHFGGFAGFSCHVSFLPEKNLAVAVFVNEAILGNQLMNMAANFAYDYFLKGPDTTQNNTKLDGFAQRLTEQRSNIALEIAKRKERKWLLSNPFSAYAGQYHSEEYGTMTITPEKSGLSVSIGNLHCEATPHKTEETIRVELLPGSGEPIQFLSENGKVTKLKYDDIVFVRN